MGRYHNMWIGNSVTITLWGTLSIDHFSFHCTKAPDVTYFGDVTRAGHVSVTGSLLVFAKSK